MDNNTNSTIHLGFLASRILDIPLMITKTKLDQILDVVGARIGLDRPVVITPQAQISSPSLPSSTDPGLAIIPIHGTLVHRSHGLSALSGMTSYDNIRSQFSDALTSSDVHSILLDIDSPGGEVAGVFDLVDTIYSSRGTKPVIAMVNERGYSAAYAIASAADRIYLSRTAGLGSIGVIMLHVDRSEANRKAGITYTPIYAGEHKLDGSPNAPLSDKARATAQEIVNSMYDLFVDTTARNLGLAPGVIRNTQAGTYHGQPAVDIGLAHAVLSYQEVIKTLTQHKGGNTFTMSKPNTPETPPVLETTETPPVAATPPETPPVTETPTTPPTLTKDQFSEAIVQAQISDAIKAERDRCTDILEACGIAKTPDLAMDLISDGSTIETTHKMIMTVLSERSTAQTIRSAVNPARSGQTNPLLADARRRADRARAQH